MSAPRRGMERRRGGGGGGSGGPRFSTHRRRFSRRRAVRRLSGRRRRRGDIRARRVRVAAVRDAVHATRRFAFLRRASSRESNGGAQCRDFLPRVFEFPGSSRRRLRGGVRAIVSFATRLCAVSSATRCATARSSAATSSRVSRSTRARPRRPISRRRRRRRLRRRLRRPPRLLRLGARRRRRALRFALFLPRRANSLLRRAFGLFRHGVRALKRLKRLLDPTTKVCLLGVVPDLLLARRRRRSRDGDGGL